MKAREPDRPSRTRWVEQPSMTLLPAAKGTCPECGTAHPPEQPHNQTSLYYQMKFNMAHGRSPTWVDAMAHCSSEVKQYWVQALAEQGISV